jgi:phospholipase/carboxylesterase
VLPIDPCSRKIVPLLQQAEYAVTYREFDGAHTIPQEIAQQAVEWFLQC